MFSGKFIRGKLIVVSGMALYYAQYKKIHSFDKTLLWNKLNDFYLDTLSFLVFKYLLKELKYFFN